MAVKMEVWGDYACFSRPELKVERMSYDVMTPSAARGILEAVYWHPGLRWIVDRIYVLSPICFTNIRRNEVKSKISPSNVLNTMNGNPKELYISTSDDIQQRAATVLRDVRYVIEAHFEITGNASPSDNNGKFCDIMRRRIEKGQFYHCPYFGVREFPVNFKLWDGGQINTIQETRDLGLMLYDMDYSVKGDIEPMFFHAKLENGMLNVPLPDSEEVLR
jgi:CRISPR-associated protein Cas5d